MYSYRFESIFHTAYGFVQLWENSNDGGRAGWRFQFRFLPLSWKKSREAVDEANIRAAYAEASAELLTNDSFTKAWTVTAQQTKDKWQSAAEAEKDKIAGIEVDVHLRMEPTKFGVLLLIIPNRKLLLLLNC